MRVNIYAEEMTERLEIIGKRIGGHLFTGLRLFLELPATVAGKQYRGPFMHRPGDDDSAAVTFWGKRDLRIVLRKALAELDKHYGDKPGESQAGKVDLARLAVRPEVARFALLMEAKLRANDHKQPWRHCSLNYLSTRLTQERAELRQALKKREDVGLECADVANFAMMIADKVGDLPALPIGFIAKCGLETEASD